MKTQRSFIKNIWLTECKLNWRKKYGVIFALAALFICALEAFYVLPKDLVKGNSIALSSWITQVYIVFGLTYGLLLYEREQSEIKELLNSYSLSKWKKTVKYLLLFIEAAGIDLGCIFLLEISFCMQHMSVAIQHEALQYIAVYWISPFVIMGITGMVLADKIEGRGKYVIGVVVMILSGPMPQNLIAALTDTQTGLFKWVSFTNLGPMNTYKPMHLLFGYSIPMEKIAMLLFMLIGVTMIYFGTGSVQMSKKWIAGVAGGIFICVACILNFNYIVGHYSYDVAMRMQEEYQKKDRFDTNNNYSVTDMKLDISENWNGLYYKADMVLQPQKASDFFTFMLYHDMKIGSIRVNGKKVKISRNKDLVVVSFPVKSDKTYQVCVEYYGNPPFQMYADKKNWILPGYFAWYPMRGSRQNVNYQDDLMDVHFVTDTQTDKIHFKVKYTGKGVLYCSLGENKSGQWEGEAQALTLLNSSLMKEIKQGKVRYIYPQVCTNYNSYVDSYAEQIKTCEKIIGEKENTDVKTYFFVCDTTNTGHGETLYMLGDCAVVEITRAYLDGAMLQNTNIGVMAYIKNYYLMESEDVNLNYIFEVAYMTALVQNDVFDQSILYRDLGEVQKLYSENGWEEEAQLAGDVQVFLKKTNWKTQKAFFDYFAGLVNTRAFSCEKVRAYMQEEKND